MQNLQNMMSFKQARKETGFTIIELVVVILLLGILAATALPRFMDVTDEAHTAVVDAVEGSLSTSAALFRAQWFGKGQPIGSAVPEFGSELLLANSKGYPALAANDSASCSALFGELLQAGGAPSVASMNVASGTVSTAVTAGSGAASVTVGPVVTSAQIEAVADNGDFIAVKTGAGGTLYCAETALGNGTCDADGYYATISSAQTDFANTVAPGGGAAVPVTYATAAAAAIAQSAAGGSCTFYYAGQYKDADTSLVGSYSADGDVLGLETLTYTLLTGDISRAVTAFQ
jgi:MSHA pilin protein MshB